MTESENEVVVNKISQTSERIYELQRLGLDVDESLNFLGCMKEYLDSLRFIRQYDQTQPDTVDTAPTNEPEPYILKKEQTNIIIPELKKYLHSKGENVVHFGVERNGGVEKVIGNIYQGSSEGDYYQSVESKATHLLYFLVKDHLFVYGNKRIAAFLFIWFLDMNGMLRREAKKAPIVSYGIIYKLTVFIAKSNPKDKNIIVDLITHIVSFHKELLLD
ncbi:Fic family protein [Candidatus Spongiihabitans sp.]|uniref:Fic family protein n=1 Tax=Candidatus Spongiihabitans sp. TaxID=3101308 RepID=UPI003C704EC4